MRFSAPRVELAEKREKEREKVDARYTVFELVGSSTEMN